MDKDAATCIITAFLVKLRIVKVVVVVPIVSTLNSLVHILVKY